MSIAAGRRSARDYGTLLLASQMEPQEIGANIRRARTQRGWTQLAFAVQAGTSVSTIQRWEAGHLPPVRELYRIADLLGIEVSELVEDPTEMGGLPSLREELEIEGRALLETIRRLRSEIEVQADDLYRAAQEQRKQAARPGQASRLRRAPGRPPS